jgi:dienelactone hydrolase
MVGNIGQAEPREVAIPVERGEIRADLTVPRSATGLVIFAHGSGSSRFSARNRFVARVLGEGGLATLLVDLLTAEEERIDALTTEYRFDIDLLTRRLLAATAWATADSRVGHLPVGYFGSSTGAAAALKAAAHLGDGVSAVVSRGGRPDLAEGALADVSAPTLLIVGGADHTVVALNREALRQLRPPSELSLVPGATHLFDEPGALEQVAELARAWLQHFLRASDRLPD